MSFSDRSVFVLVSLMPRKYHELNFNSFSKTFHILLQAKQKNEKLIIKILYQCKEDLTKDMNKLFFTSGQKLANLSHYIRND